MKIYLDVCAIGRLSDDRRQPRIAAEAEAVERVFRMIFLGQVKWLASEALEREVQRNPNQEKRNDALAVLRHVGVLAPTSYAIEQRAEQLSQLGYGVFDALHLAHAEDEMAVGLLTTDDRFIARASRGTGTPRTRVVNPIIWLQEATHGTAGSR